MQEIVGGENWGGGVGGNLYLQNGIMENSINNLKIQQKKRKN